jgi:hypothetical protein
LNPLSTTAIAQKLDTISGPDDSGLINSWNPMQELALGLLHLSQRGPHVNENNFYFVSHPQLSGFC